MSHTIWLFARLRVDEQIIILFVASPRMNVCILYVCSKTNSNNYKKKILIMIIIINDLLGAASQGLKICIRIMYETWQSATGPVNRTIYEEGW